MQAAPPGAVGRDRRRRRPRRRQGPRAPLPRRRRAWSPTSRRCSRSRPRARDRRPARSRRVLRTLPGRARGAGCRGGCATRRAGRRRSRWSVAIVGDRAGARRPAAPTAAPASRRDVASRAGPGSGAARARPPRTTTTRSARARKPRPDRQRRRRRPEHARGAPSSTTNGTLRKPGGTGLGMYLDAAPGVAAKALEIQTPTPGFSVAGLRRRPHRPVTALRHLDAARRARLAGPGRRQPRRAQRRAHRADTAAARRTATTWCG